MNLYVIDDDTKAPISGATVRVGTLDGTTDATGLFVANDVVGPQIVVAKASGHRSEVWLGANGANITIALQASTEPTPTSATLTGTITGLENITVPQGHVKTAIVSYSHADNLGDAANEIATPNNGNICVVATNPCNFTINTRTGNVALIAAIYDHDTNNTQTPSDDTLTLIGWAQRTGLTVQNGVNQTGVTMTLVDVGNLGNVTVGFGTPPSGMPNVGAIVGIELGSAGTLQLLPQFLSPTNPTVLAPKLAAFSGASYRLTAIANNGDTPTSAGSFKILRGQTSMSLDAGTWLGLPSSLTITRSGASWTAVPGALIQGVEYEHTDGTRLLSVTAFDASTSFTIPDIAALPGGTLIARATSLMGALDLQNFSLDDDLAKINGFSAQPMQID